MNSFERREDARLVRGTGRFVDDDHSVSHLHLVFVRSPYAHANIISIDLAAALAVEGVVAAFTGEDVKALTVPYQEFSQGPLGPIIDYGIAVETVKFQGEPVVCIVARSPEIGVDAGELVHIEYEPLPVVIDVEDAITDNAVIHKESGTNLVWGGKFDWGDVDGAFASAAHVVEIDKLYFHRFSSTPLECCGVIACWDRDDGVDFLTGLMQPGITQQYIAPVLGLPPEKIRIRTRDIGGAFGVRQGIFTYMTLAAIASRMVGGRSVKWAETRSEHLVSSSHGSDRTFLNTRVALDESGVILAIDSTHIDDGGAYPRYEPLGGVIWSQVAPGNYRLQNLRIDFSQVSTNKCPTGSNRGYSRMQHIWFLERVVDICGHQLGIPADEIRRRNYVPEMPWTTPNGCVYDSGDYAKMLESAKALVGWDEWRAKQKTMRAEGKLIGIGIGTTLDSGTNNFGQSKIITPYSPFSGNSEGAGVRIDGEGMVNVAMGSVPQGQSHETVAAQVVAAELGIPLEFVHVESGFDTQRDVHTPFSGTYASQFVVSSLSAVHGAVDKLRAELVELASIVTGNDVAGLKVGTVDGQPVVMTEDGSTALTFGQLWARLYLEGGTLPKEAGHLTLACKHVYRPPFEIPDLDRKYGNLTLTYAAQLHVVVVEIDELTSAVRILDYAAMDDCGRVINHTIVRGQVNGAIAHGIGAALMESLRYDENGNLLTATFSDYTPITIMNMPRVKLGNMESPSPFTYNGAKGMGEGGGCALHALSSALQDALAGNGITIQRSHYSPSELYDLISSHVGSAVVRKRTAPVGGSASAVCAVEQHESPLQ
ncbi:xanthine dehydrogenase family protein molybdopterin-binding subunit [Mesorhizobium sp.]|uniref:xanthine dehydrogenase family protein molybdopterin-binding subunit n=1 Tax=Mesorhizobium sp. TaxID=1871066 RepID=UPI000FE4BB00|nr:xanthine dehydrogenase family protein molybdopterin-binding subunit [Mesorhizobium sp.]RWA57923.1 MAG: hypothetical protein EOQ27_31905 [Mesorhizobium sp.]